MQLKLKARITCSPPDDSTGAHQCHLKQAEKACSCHLKAGITIHPLQVYLGCLICLRMPSLSTQAKFARPKTRDASIRFLHIALVPQCQTQFADFAPPVIQSKLP